ncbi:Glycosyltransferase 61 [Candidatus Nanopelagicaceae bacterium]
MSLLLLVIPTNRMARQVLDTSEIACTCGSKINTGQNRIRFLVDFLDELLNAVNYKSGYKVNVRRRVLLLLRILIKRPALLFHLCFKSKTYTHSQPSVRSAHEIVIQEKQTLWYTTSAGRFGFPWNYEAQSNSLNAVRRLDLSFLIGVYSSSDLTYDNHDSYFDIDIDTFTKHSESDRKLSIVKSTWKKTELRQLSNSKVLHGTVITKDGVVHLQYLESYKAPTSPDKLPNSLWYIESELSHPQFSSPKPSRDAGYLSEAILISSEGENFYHFISESLRVLAFSRISGNNCSNIIIRSGLPEQFYGLIRMISPESKIVKVGKNESIDVGLLHFAQFESPLSQDPRFFFDMKPSEVLDSDEFLVWRWIRSMFDTKSGAVQRVYLPREKFESRGLLNSQSLGSNLSALGFQEIKMGEMDANAQIQLFRNASIFFSASGAGLLNTIFMPANSTVIELRYPTGASWEFLPHLFDINYEFVEINKLFSGKIWESLDVYLAPTRDVLANLSRFSE